VDSVHRAVERGSSPELGLWPLRCPRAPANGWWREGWAGELNGGVTADREVVEGCLTGGVGFGNGGDS
jgi:hypothetical protein